MSETGYDLAALFDKVAEKAIDGYAQGMLSIEKLKQEMQQTWEELRKNGEQPSHALLTRIALRACSMALDAACRSKEQELYDCAFENMHRFLKRSLYSMSFASLVHEHGDAIDEVLQQTLLELHYAFKTNAHAGPRDPAAFIKWAQVALFHQAQNYRKKTVWAKNAGGAR